MYVFIYTIFSKWDFCCLGWPDSTFRHILPVGGVWNLGIILRSNQHGRWEVYLSSLSFVLFFPGDNHVDNHRKCYHSFKLIQLKEEMCPFIWCMSIKICPVNLPQSVNSSKIWHWLLHPDIFWNYLKILRLVAWVFFFLLQQPVEFYDCCY